MKVPTLVEMLKAGVHFGHQKSKRHPNMARYIFGDKNKTSIIDLEQTTSQLEEAMKVATELAAAGKTILFVGTKHQAAPIVKKYAEECGMPYVENRWLGGLLTNFSSVSSVARKLTKLKEQRDSGELAKYTKKEQSDMGKQIVKLQGLVGGIEEMMKQPDALFVVDLRKEKNALREANQMNIPVIAMCDSNVDPLKTAYPIPSNDDAVMSIEMITGKIAEAIQAGKKQAEAAAK